MKKIIQLSDSEYNELCEKATLNTAEVEKRAQELYEQKGTYGINLDIRCDQDYSGNVKFLANSYVKEWKGEFPISEEDKRKIVEVVNDRALKMMEYKFGKQISDRNHFEKMKLEYDRKYRRDILKLALECLLMASFFVLLDVVARIFL